jgi:hypothetical protein
MTALTTHHINNKVNTQNKTHTTHLNTTHTKLQTIRSITHHTRTKVLLNLVPHSIASHITEVRDMVDMKKEEEHETISKGSMAQVKQKPYGDTNLAEIPKMETLN